jgi:FMN phosphatase YigB (HAD superfamily)
MAKVGFDIDGVLYDFEDALREYMTEEGYAHPMPVATTWDFAESWGLTGEEFQQVVQ